MSVNFDQLVSAFEWTSFGPEGEIVAYICLKTGQVFIDFEDNEEELPDDLGEADHYIEVPSKAELRLGKRLALAFISEHLPMDFELGDAFFQARGAYGKFRDLLEHRGVREQWYLYEAEATKRALMSWCKDYDVEYH